MTTSFPPMASGSEGPLTIDAGPEYNQVAQHDHNPGVTCWCGHFYSEEPSAPLNAAVSAQLDPQTVKTIDELEKSPDPLRPWVSPAILEFQTQELTADNARLEFRAQELTTENARLRRQLEIATLECQQTYRLFESQLKTANDKIACSERLVASFAEFVDDVNATLIHFTGKDYAAWVIEQQKQKAA